MKKVLLLFISVLTLGFHSYSQFNYLSTGFSTFAGTYTDLGTNGTVIDSSYYTGYIDSYNDVSIAMPIGFTFNYNNRNFTHFFLATNGYIKLGDTVPPDPFAEDLYNFVTDSNLIYAFNCKLEDAPGREYRVYTSGTPGSRVCTIQFKNVRDYLGTNYSNINFQIKLYEPGCKIEFVYGSFTPSLNAASPFPTNVGLWGQDELNALNLTKASATVWSAPQTIEGPYTGNRFNNRNNVLPDAGRTFRFICTPLPNNDAKVKTIYTLSQMPRIYGFPGHRVSAVIENKGAQAINNLPVVLRITGANAFTDTTTIVSLAAGTNATIYFDSIPGSGNVGTDTLRVTVPADDDNSNNLATTLRYVNDTTYSYADNSAAAGYTGWGQLSGVMLVKYRTVSPVNVSRVKVNISNYAANVGGVIRGVVYNTLQAPVAATANMTIQAGQLGSYVTLDFNPSVQVNGEFYVGIAQIGDGVTFFYPLAYQQEGPPTRSGAYYSANISGVGVSEETSKGRFMIQADIIPAPVPVSMPLFVAEKKDKVNQLSWQVVQETNVKEYILERSEQGIQFQPLGTVLAAGLSRYQYIDELPRRGLNYYRIRIIDADGRESFSETRMLKNQGNPELAVFPNPSGGPVNVSFRSETGGRAMIQITDLSGKLLMQKSCELLSGKNLIPLNTSGLAPGTYTIRVTAENELLTKPLIRQ